jgi:DNA invertase Pin-like site-specific DNA recombinase
LGFACIATPHRLLLISKQSIDTVVAQLIGYARVSTQRQDEGAQVDALRAAGCELVFHERVSTRTPDTKREQLRAALAELRKGDTLVVSKLDRLGRTQLEVITRLHDLQSQGVHVRTLDGLINTEGLGKFAPVVVGMLTGLAEVERELIRERTLESIEHRRATGGDLGGRRRSYTKEQAELVRQLREEGDSLRTITRKVNLSLGAVQRILEQVSL